MSDGGLFVCVGESEPQTPGWLNMHDGNDADIPFQPGEDFPFEDRAIDVMVCGDFLSALARESRIRFLLECRRVLKPRGLLSIRVAQPGTGDVHSTRFVADIMHATALTGLEAANVAPVSDAFRLALAKRHASAPSKVTMEFTKRDRGVDGEPLVSIVIPAYSPRFFAASIDSAVAQTYANIEIVVCDDSEGTEIEAMTRERARYRNVRYLRNLVRLRGRGNFTKCFETARGEFIKFLCDDDLLAPTCVASLLDAFRRAPDITLATSRRRRIDEDGNILEDQPATMPLVAANTTIAGYTLANVILMAGLNTVGEPTTVLFRKSELLDQAPEYFRFEGVEGLGIIDMVIWSALLMKGDAVYLTESLSAFRNHSAQRQRDPAMAQRNMASIREIQAAWLKLKLFEKVPPHLILAKPFPPHDDSDWLPEPLLSPYTARRVASAGEHGRP